MPTTTNAPPPENLPATRIAPVWGWPPPVSTVPGFPRPVCRPARTSASKPPCETPLLPRTPDAQRCPQDATVAHAAQPHLPEEQDLRPRTSTGSACEGVDGREDWVFWQSWPPPCWFADAY